MRLPAALLTLCLTACASSLEEDAEGDTLSEIAPDPGPWPIDAVKDYSAAYSIGAVQSVGLDDAYNLWLLDGERIGVLRASDASPRWTSRVGQAAEGFGDDKRASGSTVICGGAANQAYVGYETEEVSPLRSSVDDPEFQRGDLDLVKVDESGVVSLKVHVSQSAVYLGKAQQTLGLRNTNDWHYDEDRTVLTCRRLRNGPNKGDLFVGTNHGVTMIRGELYNSHRHPVWDVGGSLRIGYNFALGQSFDGARVLMGNEWKLGILAAPAELVDWDKTDRAPWIFDGDARTVSTLEEQDRWRGFTQAKDGAYYVASADRGLFRMTPSSVSSAAFAKIEGLPTEKLSALEATKDGSVFVATENEGLWRLGADGALTRVNEVKGSRVRQLLYEPTVSPSMLLVLTDRGLTVLRGP